ncbi:MAG: YcaO-like family protein [Pseudomonadota bacterium]
MTQTTATVPLRYALRLTNTADSTGYFACVPETPLAFQEAMVYLRDHPMDAFMHQHVLGFISTWEPHQLAQALEATGTDDVVAHALVLEACLIEPRFAAIRSRFSPEDAARLTAATPLLHIRSTFQKDQALHSRWIRRFRENMLSLEPLDGMTDAAPALPPARVDGPGIVAAFAERGAAPAPSHADPEAAQAIHDQALARLQKADILDGPEMRHTASLSPIALLRKWMFSHKIRQGVLHYVLIGPQTSYGRGLQLESARAACVMEVVERWSSYASVDGDRIPGRSRPMVLAVARYSELVAEDTAVLDPNHIALEAPYTDAPLAWVDGEALTSDGPRRIRVPLQCVFLFANYDEPALFSALGSTGLATGSTMAQAKLNGLMEVIERDADLTRVFHWQDCFFLTAADPAVQRLLDDYKRQGIHLFFQDISHHTGIPCYRCFVIAQDGSVARGTAGHLDGRRAIISAMTETPHPYPAEMPSQMPPQHLPVRQLEDLPSYCTGRAETNLQLVETVLLSSGYEPISVDITTEDLAYPVCRVIVPGMEIMSDFDMFSRVSPRLLAHYRANCR